MRDHVRYAILLASALAIAACGGDPPTAPVSPTRHGAPRAAVPTTRLVLPSARAHRDLDCADLADREAARAVLSADPMDPNGLDRDRDGVACEKLH